ncbi:MAG TPA: peptidoglycan DD-metalloendopeptidase family protein [Actinomycetota bacterium]
MATTARHMIVRALLALALVAGAAVASPAFADTKSQLDSAKRALGAAQARLDQATAAWQAAEARLNQTRNDITSTRAAIDQLQRTVDRIQARLQRRAVLAFENGPAGTIDLLLSSGSFTEFSDRVEFLGSMAQADTDLVLEREVATEQLQRKQQNLAELSIRQAGQAQTLQSSRSNLVSVVGDYQSQVADLTARFKEEQQALTFLGQRVNAGGAIARCPVAGPNSFVDSFGWPRSGGRTHQGIDLIAPYGTPVVAVQPGTAEAHPNSLGGNAVIVYGPGGDWTYYAHLSSYGQMGQVGVGTVIGHVGSTGDTNVNHLHFEYHPGGGSAVDAYQALLAVC